MTEDPNLDPIPELQDELVELDAELRDIRMAERSSFGPELRAELEAGWRDGVGSDPSSPAMRRALAASVGALLFAGLLVPPARAGIAEFSRQSLRFLGVTDEVPAPVAAADPAGTASFRRMPFPAPRLRGISLPGPGPANPAAALNGTGETATVDRPAERAPELRFRPATRGGRAGATRAALETRFQPVPLPEPRPVTPVERPVLPEGLDTDFAGWADPAAVSPPYQVEAEQLLRVALGRPSNLERRFGSMENLLSGEAPAGVSILRWRASAATALEEALARDPDNPAPYLALGRIRKRQGLRAEALALFERGAQRAAAGPRTVSPRLRAELNYERGMALREAWLGVRHLGRVPEAAAAEIRCDGRRAVESLMDDLIGLNYLCFSEMDRFMREAFEPVDPGDSRERMLDAFDAAVAAHPAHVGANVELLLDRADEGLWYEMLNDARAFAWASQGDPHALLFSGLALQRLGRAEEAMADFELAMRTLPPEEVHLLGDVAPLLDPAARRSLEGLTEAELAERLEAFWGPLDPILLTDVNERRVEHLARATYAHLRLGGTDSEAGEAWIRYGRPLRVRALGEGTGLRTEFWDYGRGPALTFRRTAASADLALTAEGRAYLQDLGATLPHRYGRLSRTVESLDAQVLRLSADSGEAEVQVHTRMPEELATGQADTLRTGLFILGADGGVLSRRVRDLPAVDPVVRMAAPIPVGGERVVLELFHPGIGRAAVVRAPVSPVRSPETGPAISDLVLTEPAEPPPATVTEGAPWASVRPDPSDVSGEEVGLLFELDDRGASLGPYRLRVELDPGDGRRVIDVPIRPPGENRWAREWPRTPGGALEFLALDLRGVATGTYTLRLLVDGAVPGAPLVAERTVER